MNARQSPHLQHITGHGREPGTDPVPTDSRPQADTKKEPSVTPPVREPRVPCRRRGSRGNAEIRRVINEKLPIVLSQGLVERAQDREDAVAAAMEDVKAIALAITEKEGRAQSTSHAHTQHEEITPEEAHEILEMLRSENKPPSSMKRAFLVAVRKALAFATAEKERAAEAEKAQAAVAKSISPELQKERFITCLADFEEAPPAPALKSDPDEEQIPEEDLAILKMLRSDKNPPSLKKVFLVAFRSHRLLRAFGKAWPQLAAILASELEDELKPKPQPQQKGQKKSASRPSAQTSGFKGSSKRKSFMGTSAFRPPKKKAGKKYPTKTVH